MFKSKTAAIERSFLHGWDAQMECWHGPVPLESGGRETRRLLARVGAAGSAFQRKMSCSVRGLPAVEFYNVVYDLGDAGLALVHVDGADSGPAGILTVVPRSRRKHLRSDFAFEVMTVISLLGSPVNQGCELAINDYIEEALRTEPSASHAFAVETAAASPDTTIVLSAHFEQLAAAILEWMEARESHADALLDVAESRAGISLPAARPPRVLTARPAV